MCVSVYDLDDDRVGRRRPSAGSIVHTALHNYRQKRQTVKKRRRYARTGTIHLHKSRMHGYVSMADK